MKTADEIAPGMIVEDSLVADISMKLAAEFDAQVSRAITKLLGRSDWTLDEMRGRLHQIAAKGGDWSTLCLDGEPLLQVSEVRVSVAGGVMAATREYRAPP